MLFRSTQTRLCLILRTEHVGIYRIRDVGDALTNEETATPVSYTHLTGGGTEQGGGSDTSKGGSGTTGGGTEQEMCIRDRAITE